MIRKKEISRRYDGDGGGILKQSPSSQSKKRTLDLFEQFAFLSTQSLLPACFVFLCGQCIGETITHSNILPVPFRIMMYCALKSPLFCHCINNPVIIRRIESRAISVTQGTFAICILDHDTDVYDIPYQWSAVDHSINDLPFFILGLEPFTLLSLYDAHECSQAFVSHPSLHRVPSYLSNSIPPL